MNEIFLKHQGFVLCFETALALKLDVRSKDELKTFYKHVVKMMFVLQRHDLYAVFAYLEDRNKYPAFTLQIMQALNRFINQSRLNTPLMNASGMFQQSNSDNMFCETVLETTIGDQRKIYGLVFLKPNVYTDICSEFFALFLNHLKLELKSGIAGRDDN